MLAVAVALVAVSVAVAVWTADVASVAVAVRSVAAVSVSTVATISSESTTVSTVAVAHEFGLVVTAVDFVVLVNAHELSGLVSIGGQFGFVFVTQQMVAMTSESTVTVTTISSESTVAVTTISSESTAVSVAAVATISSEPTVAVAQELGSVVVAAVDFVVVVNAHELSSLLCVVVAEQMVAAITSEATKSSDSMAVAVAAISPESTITVAAISSESTVAIATIAVAHQVRINRFFRKLVMGHCLCILNRK